MFSCRDIEQRLDAFVDSQLPPSDLLDVARHAAGCPACEESIRRVTVLSHLVGATVEADVAALDLSGVWTAVDRRIDAIEHDRRRERWLHPLRGRLVPAWTAGVALAALAASMVLWGPGRPSLDTARRYAHRDVVPQSSSIVPVHTGPRLTGKPMLNEAIVDRLHSENAVQVKREPKDGTTLIWVHYQGDAAR